VTRDRPSLVGLFVGPRLPEALFRTPGSIAPLRRPARPRARAEEPRRRERGTPVERKYRRAVGKDSGLPEPGAILDRYRIEEVVGVGGFAVVYRATHLTLHMPVAIKLLQPRMVQRHPSLPELLCKEARFAARINHPNVVRVYDAAHGDPITYIVMELIDGVSLAEAIDREGCLAPAEVVRVGASLCDGLRAGLAQGLLHRDIKPSNVLLSAQGDIKIVDLGLAQPRTRASSQSDTGQVALVGTPGYMAPEMLGGAPLDHRADIYSLGVTLYEAACGQLPFPNTDAMACLSMHRTLPIPRPDELNPDVPPSLARLLLDMLARDPAARPASYDLLRARLREVAAGLAA